MTRPILAGALLGVLALLMLVGSTLFAEARGLHPRCNIDWPCASVIKLSPNREPADLTRGIAFKAEIPIIKMSKRERARIARGQRLEQAMPFGTAIIDPTPGAAARFIRGRLVCALNIGAELARRGIRGTGSALAKSYLHWGRPSGPQPGAVAIFSRGRRGGHVAIVDSVRPDGTVIYLNPSSRRQAWQVGPHNRRPIAFRVAG